MNPKVYKAFTAIFGVSLILLVLLGAWLAQSLSTISQLQTSISSQQTYAWVNGRVRVIYAGVPFAVRFSGPGELAFSNVAGPSDTPPGAYGLYLPTEKFYSIMILYHDAQGQEKTCTASPEGFSVPRSQWWYAQDFQC